MPCVMSRLTVVLQRVSSLFLEKLQASRISQGSLFQCWTVLKIRIFFFLKNWLQSASLNPLPHFLPSAPKMEQYSFISFQQTFKYLKDAVMFSLHLLVSKLNMPSTCPRTACFPTPWPSSWLTSGPSLISPHPSYSAMAKIGLQYWAGHWNW